MQRHKHCQDASVYSSTCDWLSIAGETLADFISLSLQSHRGVNFREHHFIINCGFPTHKLALAVLELVRHEGPFFDPSHCLPP